ncbi:MAG TPA: hypothetical protein VFZ98_02025 [Vicinamibacterales bacterium]
MSERRFLAALGAAWIVIALAAYRSILHVGFLGDDWLFLDVVSRSTSPALFFAPLNLRYVRPLIVLVYYANFHTVGLWPVPAHIFDVLLHALNAWLLSLLVLRIAPPPNRLMAAGAGLFFLVFAGHSEAVAWLAGMADAALVPFMIVTIFLIARALRDDRPFPTLAAAWTAGTAALLAKETAIVLPAIAAWYGLAGPSGATRRRRFRVVSIYIAGAVIVDAAFLWLRSFRFGAPASVMTNMGTSEGQHIAIARMFLLRLFLPPGRTAAALWVHKLDLVLIAVLAAGVAVVWLVHARDRAGLTFTCGALLLALAPALPFSISLVNTLTERYVYEASVFSAILVAWLIVRLLPSRALAVAALAIAGVIQWQHLARSNATWVRESTVFDAVVSGLTTIAARHRPMTTSAILLLNMPDAINRACVDAAGLSTRLRITGGDLADPNGSVRIAALHDSISGRSRVMVSRSDQSFAVNVDSDTLVDACRAAVPEYSFRQYGAHDFDVRLNPATRRTIVAFTSDGSVREAAVIDGVPFGFVDLPADGTACSAETLRIAGWALDDEDAVEVRIERETEPGTWVPLGTAVWQHDGARPDVAKLYRGYPSADRAGWEFLLPCSRLTGTSRLRAVAHDANGHDVVLGVRSVGSP